MAVPQKIYIGVAWPYASGSRHLGHVAGFGVPSDVFARYHRLVGNDVLMVSGSDAHGTPITVRAETMDDAGYALAWLRPRGEVDAKRIFLLGHSLESAEGDVLRDRLVLVVRQPKSTGATVGMGLAGSVGTWAGMNEQSLAVTLASSPSVGAVSQ